MNYRQAGVSGEQISVPAKKKVRGGKNEGGTGCAMAKKVKTFSTWKINEKHHKWGRRREGQKTRGGGGNDPKPHERKVTPLLGSGNDGKEEGGERVRGFHDTGDTMGRGGGHAKKIRGCTQPVKCSESLQQVQGSDIEGRNKENKKRIMEKG